MKKIKLFLASSLEGLEKDRKDLGAFIGDLNDRYEPHGVYFHLITDEDSEKALSQEAEESDLFYIIFHNEAREQAIEEFEAAYKGFVNKKKPRITTYFKKVENGKPSQSVQNFIARLSKELGHYYNNYANVDTVKLNLILQFKSLGLDEAQVKDSALYIKDKQVMTLENIPIVFNNKQLATWKEEYIQIEKEFWERLAHDNPDKYSKDLEKTRTALKSANSGFLTRIFKWIFKKRDKNETN